ncbi:MAG: MMPL family transporter [Proteobacteria bacterium]|nr:MMPL family transporter [Pseudomonadota bacterium]
MLRFGQENLVPFLCAWVGWSARHARLVVAGAALITIALAYYTWTHLSINTDTDQMIDPNLPFRQVYEKFNQTFPQLANSFLMVVDAATPEEADAVARHLVAELHGRDELVMNAYAPGTGDFFDRHGFLYLDLDELYRLTDSLADAEPVLAGLAQDTSLRGLSDVLVLALDDAVKNNSPPERLARVLADLTPSARAAAAGTIRLLSWQELFQDDEADILEGRRRIVMVQPVLDFTSFKPAKAALAEARRLGEAAEAATPGLTVRLTGKMAIRAEEMKSVSKGAKISGIVSFLLVTLILGFGIRSLRLVLAALATLAIGLIWTASFALAAIGYFNVISIAFAVLFIGLGIDFAIHFVLRYREEIWAGHDSDEALSRTARGVGLPLALAAPTTAIAFYAFAPTAYAGLAQLGIISGTGMFISLFTSLTILPALMTLMPLKRTSAPVTGGGNPVGRFIARHAKALSITGFIAGAIALIAVPQVSFDYDPIKLKDPETESVQAFQDLLARQDSSPYAAQIMAADMAEAAELKTRLQELDSVGRVVTLASYVPGGQPEKLELLSDTSVFMTPVLMPAEPVARATAKEQRAALGNLIAGLEALENANVDAALLDSARPLRLALEQVMAAVEGRGSEDGAEGAIERLEDGLLRLFPQVLNRLRRGFATAGVTLADLPADIRSRYEAGDGSIRVEVYPRADLGDQAALTRFIDDVSRLHGDVTGSAVQVKRAGEIVIGAMQQATATAAVLIILFLLLLFRAARDVALILSPVMLAAVMTAAATVWLNIPFNFANVIVLPLLIGLGVDAGIHLVMRAREESEGDRQILETSTPRAVLLSALTTVGSFGSLALSSHRGTASMGELLTISVFLTLACTLLVLPGLINWAYRKQN